MKFGKLVVLIIGILTVSASANDEAKSTSLDDVKAQVEARRKAREAASENRGIVAAPMAIEPFLKSGGYAFDINDRQISSLGSEIATILQKEVMISGRISKKRITLQTDRVDPEIAKDLLRRSLEAAGISLIAAGKHSIALIEASDN